MKRRIPGRANRVPDVKNGENHRHLVGAVEAHRIDL